MEDKMEALELEDDCEHQPSLEASFVSDVTDDDGPICPCIGSEHQAEIPNLATEDERHHFMTSSHDAIVLGYDYPVMIGLDIPIMWAPSTEVNKEEELQRQHSSETEARASSQNEDSQVPSICPTSNNAGEHVSKDEDAHPMVPVDQIESGSNQAHHENLAPSSTQEGINFANKQVTQQGEIERFTPLPGSPPCPWSALEAECFLLGLYIFGKNLSLLSRFLWNKTIGDVLRYYYGQFYKRDAYKRWSVCRKARTRRCILGERIFLSWRQQEIISRLKSKTLQETHDSLVEIFKSFSDGQTSFADFVFVLKATVGTEAFVEAVGIGKGKHDMTGFVLDPTKPNQALSVHPDMPAGKDCSSLTSEDIVKFLTGDFRRSKTRSNDLFWEAVWPRLLARGWHSEQPKDLSTTKNSLVFLVPGIRKFSSKLSKGTHYFDSISDVLKRVAADPVLLELQVNGMDNGFTDEKNGCAIDMKLDQDGPLDGYQELPKFTIIDTTLVQGEEPFKVREMRLLPADANFRSTPSHQLHNIVSASSSEEQHADDISSDDQEDRGRVTADVNAVNVLSACNPGKDKQVESLQNKVSASCSVFAANGNSSNGSGKKNDTPSFFGHKTKAERRKYLSPVAKRRRLSSCSNDQGSRRSFPFSKAFSKADGLEREKMKPLSTSSKPTVDGGGNFQTKTNASGSKTVASGSINKKPRRQLLDASKPLTNDRPNEKMNVANLNEDKSFKSKVDAVAKVHPTIPLAEKKSAKERAQVRSSVSQIKLEAPRDDKTITNARIISSDHHSRMKPEEAPSISNSDVVRDVSEATAQPVGAQPDQANSRRHGTRNRPPTAKALEAVAFGLLGTGKRKGEPRSPGASRPPQRARKSPKRSVSASTPTSSDTEKSSMEPDAQG